MVKEGKQGWQGNRVQIGDTRATGSGHQGHQQQRDEVINLRVHLEAMTAAGWCAHESGSNFSTNSLNSEAQRDLGTEKSSYPPF